MMKGLALVLFVLAVVACKQDKPPMVAPLHTATGSAGSTVVLPPSPKAPPRPAELQHVTLKALGMYCEESCPLRVRYALADNKSVYELGFDTANEAIFVSYDIALGAPKEVTKSMLKAIKDAGFDPWLAKDSWPDDAQSEVQVVLR